MIRKILFSITLLNSLVMIWFIEKIEHKIVPLHYNIYGNANYHGSKWTLLVFAAIPLILSLVFWLRKDFTKKNYKNSISLSNCRYNSSIENKIIPFIVTFFLLVGWIALFTISNNSQKLDSWVIPCLVGLIGLLITCISVFMPQIKPNRYLGIRTSATFKSADVWNKTHRVGFYTGITGGILTIIFAIISLLANIKWLCFAGVICGILGTIIPVIYSYFVTFKK